jgi:hypothetical protein
MTVIVAMASAIRRTMWPRNDKLPAVVPKPGFEPG